MNRKLYDTNKIKKNRNKRWFLILLIILYLYTPLCYCNEYYLDDVIVTYKEKGKRFKDESKFIYDEDTLRQVAIKNSDWTRCPLSSKFLQKYNNLDSIFPEYEIVDVKFLRDDSKLENSNIILKANKYIERIIHKDSTENICLFYFVKNDYKEVDDILTYIVPEDKLNLSYEEMYELAFNE